MRIYPTKTQKELINEWFGTRRYVYNKSLEEIKKGTKCNFFELRNKLVTKKNNPNVHDWQLKTPKDIRAGAIRDLVKTHKINFDLLKTRKIKKFNMKYSSKKNSPASLEIPKSSVKIKNNELFIFKTYLPEPIKYSKKDKLNLNIKYDCRLQLKNNKWFLIIPIINEVKEILNRKRFCSLDPGVRNFQTVYSEDTVMQIKIRKENVKKLQVKLDQMRSLRSKKIIKNKSYKKRERRIFFKLNNFIDDLHYKTISTLTDRFRHIILPSFESQEMVRRSKNKCLNRNLLQLKHYLFQQRLSEKCRQKNCSLHICTEEYTSQTCGRCGELTKIKNNDVFKCNNCNLIIDRDINGARNIAIKFIKETL
jgi:putative transposase